MAYHSKLDTSIYHECKNCTVGNNIEKANLKEGKPAGASKCKVCATLQSEKKCTWGTPTPAQ
ncbi:MAG: hypothetical protein KKI08_24210 [Armatimonadetes bacterium]|nr:hypothetical protein [Armatimonadota bacterium]